MLWIRWRRGISKWMVGVLWVWRASQGLVCSIHSLLVLWFLGTRSHGYRKLRACGGFDRLLWALGWFFDLLLRPGWPFVFGGFSVADQGPLKSNGEECSESWGMGAEEFRKAPMMHHKLTTLAITRYTTEQTCKRLKNCKLVSSANYYTVNGKKNLNL